MSRYWIHSAPEDYSEESGLRDCARAERCSDPRFEDHGGKMVRLPALTPRAFCDKDRGLVLEKIEEIPELYTLLYIALSPSGSSTGLRISGSKTPPVPLRAGVEALMRDVVSVVSSWEEVVRDVARLSESPTGSRRDGVAVTTGCRVLVTHVDVLLALPVSPQTRILSLKDASELPEGTSGIVHKSAEFAVAVLELGGEDAGLEILRLHARCRSMLGMTKRRDLITVPCFNCGHSAIYRDETWDGLADEAYCGNCAQMYTGTQWKVLQKLVYEEELKRQKVG